MKLKVEFYMLDNHAKDVKAGEISYDGESIAGSNAHMEEVRNTPITIGSETITSQDEPERFLRHLRFVYYSPYFRALVAK